VIGRRQHEASREKPRGADPELSLGLRVSTRPDGHDRGCANQFDPVIDKERKLISNLRWNIPLLVQIVPNIWPSGQQCMAID
jgi:hypothetical protein